MMAIRQWQWGIAFGLACALHLGLAVAMIWKVLDPPAEGLGKGGLEIQLTREGSRPAESAHTRNEVRAAAQRASGEAAPLVRAARADKTVLPDEVADSAAVDEVHDESRPEVPASPVPVSAETTKPASADQPVDLADARAVAAPAADSASAPNSVQPSRVSEEAVPNEVADVAAAGVDRSADQVSAAPVEARTAENVVAARSADVATEVEARPVASPAGDVPLPDALPPLEQATSVSPDSANRVATVATPETTTVADVQAARPVEQINQQPVETATVSSVPLATATQLQAVAAPAAAPQVPTTPSIGEVETTRSGDDVQNAGAVGPDATVQAVVTGTNAKVRARSGSGSGNDRRDAQGGKGGDKNRYLSLVQAWIQMHRRYPEKAREAGQEGVALVYVVVTRDGRALEHRILQSTGFPLLDAEILEAVTRAMPLPKIPDTVAQDQMKLILPVRFALKR
jgi:protein TonB